MSDSAKPPMTLRFALDTPATPDASVVLLTYLGHHPLPWKASWGKVSDANGRTFLVIDGDGYEERYAMAQLLAALVNSARPEGL